MKRFGCLLFVTALLHSVPLPGQTTSTLEVVSSPSGAEVLLDGASTGKLTPATFPVFPGTHQLTVRAMGPGWIPAVRSVVVAQGTNSVSVVLRRQGSDPAAAPLGVGTSHGAQARLLSPPAAISAGAAAALAHKGGADATGFPPSAGNPKAAVSKNNAPELDPGSLAGAVTLLIGGLMILRDRRRRN